MTQPTLPTPQLTGPWVDVRSFAPPEYPRDGTRPWDQFIQLAVDYIVDNGLTNNPPGIAGTLYLPPGRYLINNPIRIRRLYDDPKLGRRYTFCSIQITGDAPPYGAGDFHGSAIITGFADKPAVIIQAGRAVRIENLAIIGKNDWVARLDNAKIDVLYDDANFLAPGVSDDRPQAPYAGICIDPFARIPDPPPSPLELYPCLAAEYLHSGGSSDISIERCYISGFVVGIAISPNGLPGSTRNAENISIDGCSIVSTKSAIAIGQDQTRGMSCSDLRVYGAKYAIDCVHYGNKSGCCPSVFNANISLTKYIFNTFSFGSGASFNGIYCEKTLSLGVLGGGGSFDGYVFNGCAFNLVYAPGRPSVAYHLATLARATFNACQLALSGYEVEEAAPLWIYSAGVTSFRDCLMGVVNYPDNSPSFWILGAPQRTTFSNTMVVYRPGKTTVFSEVLAVDKYTAIVNQAVLPGCLLHQLAEPNHDNPPPNPDHSPRWVASGLRTIPLGTVRATDLKLHDADGTATFQPTAPGVVAPGDLVTLSKGYFAVIEGIPSTPIAPVLGKVTSIDPQTGLVTLSYAPEFVFDTNNLPDPDVDRLTVVGFYKIHQPVTGRVTADNAGNRTITIPPNISAATWIVGDRIRAKEGFIPAHAYVAAVQTDPNQPSVLREIALSQPLTGIPANGLLTLYDADVRIFTSTQVY